MTSNYGFKKMTINLQIIQYDCLSFHPMSFFWNVGTFGLINKSRSNANNCFTKFKTLHYEKKLFQKSNMLKYEIMTQLIERIFYIHITSSKTLLHFIPTKIQ
jgi:hypothetical protein